jgi:hypothetical protein
VLSAFALLMLVLVCGGPIEDFFHRRLHKDKPLPTSADA